MSDVPEPGPGPLRRSWLDDRHRAAGAKLVPFGGWDMPLSYTGVLDEHRACRTGAVVFDVSHLGTLLVAGPGALGALQGLLTNDLSRIEPGRAQYTHLLDADDAHVVDDIIVWWRGTSEFLVMPNASNTVPALQAFATAMAEAPEPFTVTDVTCDRVLLAVQGPAARERLATVVAGAAAVERFSVATVAHGGVELTVGGTGYTGEDGVELSVPVPGAAALWDALLAAGVTPAGLGARDTLRLEMGYPLHGHELGPGITPLQAGFGLGGLVGQGPVPGARRPRGRARAGDRAAPAGPAPRGPAGPAGRLRRARRRPGRRPGHQRELLAHAGAGDRPGLPAARRRAGHRRRGRRARPARAGDRGGHAVRPRPVTR